MTSLRHQSFVLPNQFTLLISNSTNIIFKLLYLVYFSFSTIPCGHLLQKVQKSFLTIAIYTSILFAVDVHNYDYLKRTLFFPLLLISRHMVNCSSVSSCLDKRSLNSSIGRLIMSITEIGNLILCAVQKNKLFLKVQFQNFKINHN